jgi:hypothetical protein
MEGNGFARTLLCLNLEITRPRVRLSNRWQDHMREDGSVVGGKMWQQNICKR